MASLLFFASNRLTKFRKTPTSTADDYTFYSYDHRNRQVAVTFCDGDAPSDDQLSKVEYGYGVFGRRIYSEKGACSLFFSFSETRDLRSN